MAAGGRFSQWGRSDPTPGASRGTQDAQLPSWVRQRALPPVQRADLANFRDWWRAGVYLHDLARRLPEPEPPRSQPANRTQASLSLHRREGGGSGAQRQHAFHRGVGNYVRLESDVTRLAAEGHVIAPAGVRAPDDAGEGRPVGPARGFAGPGEDLARLGQGATDGDGGGPNARGDRPCPRQVLRQGEARRRQIRAPTAPRPVLNFAWPQ